MIHVIGNYAAADLTANLLLAAGAKVVMAQDKSEAEDFVALADALCLNLGILTLDRVEPMVAAARFAIELGRPWVLDPVAVGTSAERRALARRLSGLQPTVIRGNATEILAMAEDCRGGDGCRQPARRRRGARRRPRSVARDRRAGGGFRFGRLRDRRCAPCGGRQWPSPDDQGTGVGCALSALMAACCSVEEDALRRAATPWRFSVSPASWAAAEAAGPASFRIGLIDRLYGLDRADLDAGARIQ